MIEVIWKRILLLGSENLTKMIQYIIVADADSIFVVILVQLINTVFVNATNISINIETSVLSLSRADLSSAKHRSVQSKVLPEPSSLSVVFL